MSALARLWLAAFCAAAATGRAADEPAPLSERDYLADYPVVLSASRLAQPITETPSAVTIIDREAIHAAGFRVLSDLFRLVPGFTVGHFRASQPSVTYHGLSDDFSKRLQVLVDGRSIYSPGFGQVEWTELPLAIEDIERIEVVRGPNAASFGSNSFLAIINIITRHSATTPGFYAMANAGEDDIGDGVVRFGEQRGDLDYRITLGSRGDDGFEGSPGRTRIHFFNARSDYRPTNRDEIELQAGLSLGEREQGDIGEINDPPRDEDVENYFLQARWKRVFDPDNELSVSFYHVEDRVVDDVDLVLPPPAVTLPLDFTRTTVRDSLELQWTRAVASDVRVVSGFEVRHEEGRSRGFLNVSKDSGYVYRAFGNLEWRARRSVLLHAGALLEDHYFTGTDVSPRIALNYFPAPGHSFRAGIAKAYRTPSFLEEKANAPLAFNGLLLDQIFLSRGGLEPESVVSREIGYVANFPRYGVTLDARIFRDRFEDLIVEDRLVLPPGTELFGDDTARTFVNADDAHASGFEYQIDWRPGPRTRVIFNQSFVDIDSDDVGLPFSRSAPSNTTNLLAIHRLAYDVTASAGYYYVDEMNWLGSPTPAYDRLDLRLAKLFQNGRHDSELALTIQGLLGPHKEFQEEHVYRRRAFVTLRTQF